MPQPHPRVVCFVQDAPPIVYFSNRIAEAFDVPLIVIERPPSRPRRLPKSWIDAREALWRSMRHRRGGEQRQRDYQKWFGDRWRRLESPRILQTQSINSDEVIAAVRQLSPDVVVDHGTSLLREEVVAASPLILNLHWGLSPYYRGVSCTDWALTRWDPLSIGVTIHRISQLIDGGDIVVQRRATVTPEDTVHSIDCQLTAIGTELMVEALHALGQSGELPFHRQDVTKGFLCLSKHASPWLARHVAWLEDSGMIGSMLRHPARPGVELIAESING